MAGKTNKMRNNKGQFIKGFGFWSGKKRLNLKKTNASKTMFKKGQKPWNVGLQFDLETRKKMSLAKIGVIPWNKGIKTPQTGTKGDKHPMWKGGKPKCLDCFKELAKYGTKRCRSCANTGKLSPAWRGGITPQNKIIRRSKEFKAWRVAVFVRDNYICQMCGKKGGTLHPDHIKSFAFYPDLRFDINNGRTLCIECHKLTPNYGMKAVVLERAVMSI